MFGAPVTLQGLDQGVGAGFDPAISQRGQAGGVPFTGQDGVGYRHAGYPGQIGDGMVHVDVHLIVRFLHVQHASRCRLHQGIAMPKQGAQRAHLLGRSKGAAQQSGRVQMAQPLAVGYVALAARCRAHQTSVDQHHLKAACFQDLERWNPVHSRRLHGDGRDLAFREPVRQRMQIAGERRKVADRRAGAVCANCGVHRSGAHIQTCCLGIHDLRLRRAFAGAPLPASSHGIPPLSIQVGRPRREQTAFSLSGWPPPAGVDLTNDSATGLGTKLDYGFAPAGGHQ